MILNFKVEPFFVVYRQWRINSFYWFILWWLWHWLRLSFHAVNVVPSVDQKVTDVAIAIEPAVDSSESVESSENHNPTELIAGVTQSAESAESTESSVDNQVLKTSDTSHRRYHYPRYQNRQYYRQPVANVYHNKLLQHPLVVNWLNGNRNQPLSSDEVDSILFDLTGYYDSGVDILTWFICCIQGMVKNRTRNQRKWWRNDSWVRK